MLSSLTSFYLFSKPTESELYASNLFWTPFLQDFGVSGRYARSQTVLFRASLHSCQVSKLRSFACKKIESKEDEKKKEEEYNYVALSINAESNG